MQLPALPNWAYDAQRESPWPLLLPYIACCLEQCIRGRRRSRWRHGEQSSTRGGWGWSRWEHSAGCLRWGRARLSPLWSTVGVAMGRSNQLADTHPQANQLVVWICPADPILPAPELIVCVGIRLPLSVLNSIPDVRFINSEMVHWFSPSGVHGDVG